MSLLHKILGRMANNEDPDQTAQEQSDLGLHCLHMQIHIPFRHVHPNIKENKIYRKILDFPTTDLKQKTTLYIPSEKHVYITVTHCLALK